MLLGDALYDHGAIAIYVQGAVRLRTVVSQGCRPIGDPFVITQAYGNTVYQLGGTAAHQRLNEVYQTLATREREMLQRGVHLGRVVNEYQERFEQGDFLVRNVMGVDADRGGLVIGDHVRAGQTVQFHVRDAETADAELRQLLSRAKAASDAPPAGALLFTCNGRGSRLFAQPHHDVAAIEQILGGVPVAGFFAAGEVGPIGERAFCTGSRPASPCSTHPSQVPRSRGRAAAKRARRRRYRCCSKVACRSASSTSSCCTMVLVFEMQLQQQTFLFQILQAELRFQKLQSDVRETKKALES